MTGRGRKCSPHFTELLEHSCVSFFRCHERLTDNFECYTQAEFVVLNARYLTLVDSCVLSCYRRYCVRKRRKSWKHGAEHDNRGKNSKKE